MAFKAPTETWIQIFEETIGVPEFFCSDPLTTYGMYSWSNFRIEGYYWRAERWRNALRRVHSSWNVILDRREYRHRFVRISDVTHGCVPEEEIPWDMTMRIAFGAYQNCACKEYCIPWTGVWMDEEEEGPRVMGASLEVINRITIRHQQKRDARAAWRLRLLDGVPMSATRPDLFRALSEVANITAINTEDSWETLDPRFNHLLHYLQIKFNYYSTPEMTATSLSFPRLTTLVIRSYEWVAPIENLQVPALRHLFISGYPSPTYQVELDGIIAVVRAVGRNLRTFHYSSSSIDGVLPLEFWRLVPHLLQLLLDCIWTHPPPRDHPLTTILIQGTTIIRHVPGPRIDSYPSSFRSMPGWPLWSASTPKVIGIDNVARAAEWAGRRACIRITNTWERIFFRSSYLEPCQSVIEEYNALGWTFTDYTGRTFNQFLVYLLETRRLARAMGDQDWNPPGYTSWSGQEWMLYVLWRPRDTAQNMDRDILEHEQRIFEHF